MKTRTNEYILKQYLLRRIEDGKYEVSSSNIESDLVRYARDYWGKSTNPSTFSRLWRKLKENGEVLDYFIRPKKSQSEGTWILTKNISNLQRPQLAAEVV